MGLGYSVAESGNAGYVVNVTGAQGTITAAGVTAAFTNHRQVDDNDINISVTKLWYGDSSLTRPTYVTVQLYRNGYLVDTATLSANNNWSKTWYGLSGTFIWTVDEVSVPAGYTKQVIQTNGRFTITNTQYTYAELPKTGGEGDLTFACALMAGGILCAAIVLIRRKKTES